MSTTTYRWNGSYQRGAMALRREVRRDEADERNREAQPVERKPCLHRHGRRSHYGRTVCGVWDVIAESYRDTREVRFDLPSDLPEHRTPKGKRPLRLRWMTISYSLVTPGNRAHISVEVGGSKLENDARYGPSTVGDFSRRSFFTPRNWARGAAPASFDELGLPEWARPYVEDNRPVWCPAPEFAS